MIAMNVISILYVIFKLYQDLFYPIYPWIYIYIQDGKAYSRSHSCDLASGCFAHDSVGKSLSIFTLK